MPFSNVTPYQWLTDRGLTTAGQTTRAEYEKFCRCLQQGTTPSWQSARGKYFLQALHYWTLPEGFALPPHTINVCVNNQCNLHCRYCDFGQHRTDTFYYQYNVIDTSRKTELPIETCKNIVDQVKWFHPIIRASFREPLLYAPILDFIAYTKQNGLPFWLLTNGINLTRFAGDLVRLEVDSIRISLDGPPEVHNRIRGSKNAYQRMLSGVKLLLEERRRQGSSMDVGFYFTVNDLNFDQILATADNLAAEGLLGEVFLSFQWLLYTTPELAQKHNQKDAIASGAVIQESSLSQVDLNRLDPEEMGRQARAVSEKYPASRGYRIHFRPSFEPADLRKYRETEEFPVDDARCLTPWYNLNINPAGEVKSFHHCLLPATGNIRKEPILDIWNGEAFRKQRLGLQEHGAYTGCARCWGLYSLLENLKRKD